MLKVGVIGFGNRMSCVVDELFKSGEVEVASVADIDIEGVKKKFTEPKGLGNISYYTDAEEMLKNEKLDGVCIGTRCSTHAKYAVLVAKYGLPTYLEKPVCTTYDDLNKLKGIMHMSDKVVVSFPLRLSNICLYVKNIIDSGKIGEIAHVQGYNNVPYARGYYEKWYRDENETGGLFLQKATHDLDYINFLIGTSKPVCVSAMKSKQVFGGDMPAGLKCVDCDKTMTCPESPENVAKLNQLRGDYCCFAVDTGNEDSGSVLVQYDNGMHVVYSQNFIVRNNAGKRGARLVGFKGTVEFDWYTGIVMVYHHQELITETHTFASSSGHFGGDEKLCENFIGVMKGTESSRAPLSEGILSAELCLAARRSAEERVFVNIESQ